MLGFVGGGNGVQTADSEAESTPGGGAVASSDAATDPPLPVTALPRIPRCARASADGQESEQLEAPDIERAALPGVVQVLTDQRRGSGFVADSDGIIVTDSQVIAGSWLIRVRLSDGTTLNGELFGIDERIGVAYVEVAAGGELEPIAMGDSDEVCVGDAAFAIGYPHSDGPTREVPGITQGLISASTGNAFKTDAPLGPGSVGGPLLNTSGLVVGINSSGIEVTGDRVVSASNFAIPINAVRQRLADGLDREDLTTTVFLPPRTPTPRPVGTIQPTPTAVAVAPSTVAPAARLAPTPTPAPDLVPTATPRPAPTRMPTATPRLAPTRLPTATPRPAPTRLPTATPGPAPARRPTATPMPTPTPTRPPTATPRPTPTPAGPQLATYTNDQYGYTIDYPRGWRVDQDTGSVVVFVSGDGGAFLEILAESISSDWSLGQFIENYRLRTTRRAPSWDDYRETSIKGEFRGAINYIHQEFRRKETASSCTENGVSHLYRSMFFPVRLNGFVVTMSICEDSLRRYGPVREAVLTSFEEFQTN